MNHAIKKKIAEFESLQTKFSDCSNEKNLHEELINETNKLIMEIFNDLAKFTEQDDNFQESDTVDETFHKYKVLQVLLEEKIYSFNEDEDEFNQNSALIEQLRFDKVELQKKYRHAMDVLLKTYGDYATAFGLDPIQGDNIEIDDFVKLISDEQEST